MIRGILFAALIAIGFGSRKKNYLVIAAEIKLFVIFKLLVNPMLESPQEDVQRYQEKYLIRCH